MIWKRKDSKIWQRCSYKVVVFLVKLSGIRLTSNSLSNSHQRFTICVVMALQEICGIKFESKFESFNGEKDVTDGGNMENPTQLALPPTRVVYH